MECFKHLGESGVGLCKSCFKAVCKSCAIELEHGLACSEECATDVKEYNEMQERGKSLYGIGPRKSRVPATGVILWSCLTAIMWAAFFIPYLVKGDLSKGNLAIAVGFTIIWG
ncbi:hypothetical protein OAO01_08500, partial [Oligoflexia bacterium]|nr:hypothetical protein [Oligoflexia bacterium]